MARAQGARAQMALAFETVYGTPPASGFWIRRCREGHVTPAEAWDEIVAYNAALIDPPWPDARLAQEAERLWKRDLARNGGPDDGEDELRQPGGSEDGDGPTPVRFTEDALAATFAARHSERWRYVAGWGQWLTWTGSLCRIRVSPSAPSSATSPVRAMRPSRPSSLRSAPADSPRPTTTKPTLSRCCSG